MKVISKIRIEGFRSIKNSSDSLESLENFNAFVGLNNSGKSNILRALNVFFSGYTDLGAVMNFSNDYYRYDLHKKRTRKNIQIAVTFLLPDNFKFPKKLSDVKTLLGKKFTITKRWDKSSNIPDYFLNNNEEKSSLEQREQIDQFLALINFRYIPNRVLPIEIIKSEHQALKDVLIRRLGKEGKESSATFDVIQKVSDRLIRNLAERLNKMSKGVNRVRLSTPKNWADMVFAFGYKLGDGQVELEDSSQGSGIQSLLMLETLYLIDKDYFQQFGWRQAAIWAIEEPESSLHSSMEAQVAAFLNTISNDKLSRLQIFSTTHSDLILQYADKGFFVTQESNQTRFNGSLDKKAMLGASSESGISRYSHPILFYPLEPIILPDGKYDCPFIEQAIRLIDKNIPVKILHLEQFDKEKTGGESDVYNYLIGSKEIIKNREKAAPIIVMLDWEDERKKEKWQSLANGLNGRLKIFIWDKKDANPMLGRTFKGIERFYSDRLINIVERKCPDIIAKKANNVKTIEQADYEIIKKKLYDEIISRPIRMGDVAYAKKTIAEIIGFIKGL